MRIIIAGSRDFDNYVMLCKNMKIIIDRLIIRQSLEEVCGCARGADTLGAKWAREIAKISVKEFPANWNKYGNSAGHRRNAEMAQYAAKDEGILVAFWDSKSCGTKSMIELAHKHKLKIFIVRY